MSVWNSKTSASRWRVWVKDQLDDITTLSATAWRMFYSGSTGSITELALGADGTLLTSTGASTAPAWEVPVTAGLGLVTVIVADDATWAPNSNSRLIKFTCTGAGGGGGGTNGQGNSTAVSSVGGGGGGTAIKWVSTIDTTYALVIGTGGAAGAAGNSPGSNGTASTVIGLAGPGDDCNLSGGGGDGGAGSVGTGNNSQENGANGGAASGGDLNYEGDASGGTTVNAGKRSMSSGSGVSIYGGLVKAKNAATSIPGVNPGCGGGGNYSQSTNTNYAGAVGAVGIILIEEYF